MGILSIVLGCFFSFELFATFVPANRPYDASLYKIELRLDPRARPKSFSAKVLIRLKALKPIQKVELDSSELQVIKAWSPGSLAPLTFDQSKPHTIEVSLGQALAEGAETEIALEYEARIFTTPNGLFTVVDPDEPNRGALYFTHFEPVAARSFFPCNDEPYDKAVTEVIAHVPDGYQAISNGSLVQEASPEAGWKFFHWKMDKPHSTYLVSLAVGKFAQVSADYQGKTVSVWTAPGKVDKARYALESTLKSMAFFEDFLGVPYPWPKYATVTVPTFVWGGMENTSSTHMNQDRTLLNDPQSESEKAHITGLAAHELAHQWFGDLATMRWWDDIWLNETFANYLDGEASENAFKGDEILIQRVRNAWDRYFRQENGPRSHPIVNSQLESPLDGFDAISYTKGEHVLRMLEFYVGRDKLRAGMKLYLNQNAYANATYQDFFGSVSKAAGHSLDSFRDSWVLQRGYPVLQYSGAWKEGKLALSLKQHSNHASDKTVFEFRVPVVFHRRTDPAYSIAKDWIVRKSEETFKVGLPAAPEWITVNPRSVVLAKVIQQNRDEDTLAKQALQDPDSVSRLRAALDLGTPMIEGTGPLTSTANKTLNNLIQSDPSPYVRIAILSALREMKTKWISRDIGYTLIELAKSPQISGDERAQRQWRAALWATIGKVDSPEVLAILKKLLLDPALPLDDVSNAALGVATHGKKEGLRILQSALKTHGKRGYRYRYVIEFAYGAFESPEATVQLKSILSRCSSDLAGRIVNLIRNNQALVRSESWPAFLKGFLAKDQRHGDEVHSRLLQTIEEVKTPAAQKALESLSQGAFYDRVRALARKIKEKNFT